jgi:hypothetical protein
VLSWLRLERLQRISTLFLVKSKKEQNQEVRGVKEREWLRAETREPKPVEKMATPVMSQASK